MIQEVGQALTVGYNSRSVGYTFKYRTFCVWPSLTSQILNS